MSGRPPDDDGLPREQVFDFAGGDDDLDLAVDGAPAPRRPTSDPQPHPAGARRPPAATARPPGLGGLADLAATARAAPTARPIRPTEPMATLPPLEPSATVPSAEQTFDFDEDTPRDALPPAATLEEADLLSSIDDLAAPLDELAAPWSASPLDELAAPYPAPVSPASPSPLDLLAAAPSPSRRAVPTEVMSVAPSWSSGGVDPYYPYDPSARELGEPVELVPLPDDPPLVPDDPPLLAPIEPYDPSSRDAQAAPDAGALHLMTAADQALQISSLEPFDPSTRESQAALETTALPLMSAAEQAYQLSSQPYDPSTREPSAADSAPPLVSAADQAFLLSSEVEPTHGSRAAHEMDLDLPPPAAAAAPPLMTPADQTFFLGSRHDTTEYPAVQVSPPGAPPGPADAGLDLAAVAPTERPRGTVFTGATALPAGPLPATSPLVAPPPGVPGVHSPEVVHELFMVIDKAVKMLNLYEGRGETCEKAVATAHEQLRQVVSGGELAVQLTPYEFLLGPTPIYTSQDDRKGLSYRLFRDGLRELRLLPGIYPWELSELLEIMRDMLEQSTEDDSVTLLWEKNLPGVRYEAIDIFLEGLLESDTAGFEEQLNALVATAAEPLHAAGGLAAVAELRASLDPASMDQSRAWRQQKLGLLRRDHGAATLATIRAELPEIPSDLWRRTMGLVARLLQTGEPRSEQVRGVADLLAQVLEEMWRHGRWDVLAAACRAIGEIAAASKPDAARLLQLGLSPLCAPERLNTLQPVLDLCSVAEFNKLAELFHLLPAPANPQLAALLARMPVGEVQDRFAALLIQRGVDLIEFQRKRLQSPNLAHVLSAISVLMTTGRRDAIVAIRAMLNHANGRVRLEALRALRGGLDDKAIPQLISSLLLDNRELRELCFEELEPLQLRAHTAQLLEVVKNEEFEAWNPVQRRRMLQLLLRSGGPEAADFAVKRIAALNPFRRQKVEIDRQEMIDAVRQAGGPRARKIIEASLASRLPEAARATLEAALKGMDR